MTLGLSLPARSRVPLFMLRRRRMFLRCRTLRWPRVHLGTLRWVLLRTRFNRTGLNTTRGAIVPRGISIMPLCIIMSLRVLA